jgi:translation elongation factor EF-4
LKALLFDSWFDIYKGVVCLMAVMDGQIKIGEKIVSANSRLKYEVMEVGILRPNQISTGVLYAGQVGYVITGMRSAKEAHIGDTFCSENNAVVPFSGFRPAKPKVFAGVFPVDGSDFDRLRRGKFLFTSLFIQQA